MPVVLDLDDEPLAAAARGGGAVLTPNADELARLLGAVDDPVASVRDLAARTGAPVVLTLGERGLLAHRRHDLLAGLAPPSGPRATRPAPATP